MNTLDAIAARRSIRRYTETPVPDDMLNCILQAAIQAPSGKNMQPWRFIIVKEDKRAEMVSLLREGIKARRAEGMHPGSSEWSALIMEHAPVTVFVFNPEGAPPWEQRSMNQTIDDVINIQSVGAAIQNMLLAAKDLGLGSLWICDVFYAYEELRSWLGETGAMIAAITFGYPDEDPAPRPRKPFDEVVRTF